jgi:hypothetical protein
MTKGHNQEDQQKPNIQQGAKTVNAKESHKGMSHGRNANEKQSVKKSGDRKGLNDV